MAKNIRGFLENLADNFLNIIVNVNFFGDLNITEYYAEILLNVSLKKEIDIDGRGHEIFSEKISGS